MEVLVMRKKELSVLGLIITGMLVLAVLAGCKPKNNASNSANAKAKVVITYAGGTCEAPIFVAYHKGFFEEEGLEVEILQAGFEQLKLGLDTGTIDATMANFAWFKPIEQGLRIKLTGGIHTGCIKAVIPPNSDIKSFADLKGKTIGVDAIGGGPQIALSVKLREAGLNPSLDVNWVAYPGPQLDEAIAKGEIAAYMTWDPFPTLAHDHNHYKYLLDIGADQPFQNQYCCFVGVSGTLVEKNPETAAKITRALLKASEWVGQNPKEAAQISIDNKYIGGDVEVNAQLLGSYDWEPSISKAKENIRWFVKELKTQGILEASTSENQLYGATFAEVIPDYKGK